MLKFFLSNIHTHSYSCGCIGEQPRVSILPKYTWQTGAAIDQTTKLPNFPYLLNYSHGAVGPGFLLVHDSAWPQMVRVCSQCLKDRGMIPLTGSHACLT